MRHSTQHEKKEFNNFKLYGHTCNAILVTSFEPSVTLIRNTVRFAEMQQSTVAWQVVKQDELIYVFVLFSAFTHVYWMIFTYFLSENAFQNTKTDEKWQFSSNLCH